MGNYKKSNIKRRYGVARYGGRSYFGGRNFYRPRKNRYNKFDESQYIKKAVSPGEIQEYIPHYQFSELNVHPDLKKNIAGKGYAVPTPIQDQAIPLILEGKDLVGIANTGTGKTAAFLIPLVDKILRSRDNKVLIVTPTRELAEQINQEIYQLARYLRIFSVLCIGGRSVYHQISQLKRSYSLVIGTPGRLKDLLERKAFNLSQFSTVVLDEVDRMLDMGFIHDIKYLISLLPKERQSLFFSATVDNQVENVIKIIVKKEYVKVSVKTGETAQNINQDVIRIRNSDEKIPKLVGLLHMDSFKKVLIFVNTRHGVDRLNKRLHSGGFRVDSIHGYRKQHQRQKAIENFKSGRVNVLIATDVAARGLDIEGVTHVINYDIPQNYGDYVHRIGRTGRVDKFGTALTFVEKRY
jgi:ATP-dependent RNA helicase RhlE